MMEQTKFVAQICQLRRNCIQLKMDICQIFILHFSPSVLHGIDFDLKVNETLIQPMNFRCNSGAYV